MVKHVRPCSIYTYLMLSAVTKLTMYSFHAFDNATQTKDELVSEPGYRASEKSAAGIKHTCVGLAC